MDRQLFSIALAFGFAAAALLPAPLSAETGLLDRARKILQRGKKDPSKSSRSKDTIEGLCGLRLGDRMPAGRLMQAQKEYLEYQFTPTEPLPGISFYWVGVLPISNRIVRIEAFEVLDAPNPEMMKQILARLTARFGESAEQDGQGNDASWAWARNDRLATLLGGDVVVVQVTDAALLAEGAREMEQWRARPTAPATLGGPAYLSGATLDTLFGLSLGSVFPPPAEAQPISDGLHFYFAPRQPLAQFSRYSVVVSPKSHRVLKIYGYADRVAEAQIRSLAADLTARFGPSTLRAPVSAEPKAANSVSWRSLHPEGTDRSLVYRVEHNGDVSLGLADEALVKASSAERGAAR